jgi:murein DD-endopeptidase MepM/ murein hydrolase activator NlpD
VFGRFFAVVGCASALVAPAAAAAPRPPVPDDASTAWQGWPLWPLHKQHPIRGGFLDPRGSHLRPIFHDGIDIAVRDDRPERGHPPDRTHRVYAVASGTVSVAPNVDQVKCNYRTVRVGNWGYGHVDPVGTVADGEHVEAGQQIGWSCRTLWHVHLGYWTTVAGRQVYVNPLRSGVLEPYVDTAKPKIGGIRFTPPSPSVAWASFVGSIESSLDVVPLDPSNLRGVVDVSASVSDPQSFRGWLAKFPRLRANQVPYSIRVSLTSDADGDRVLAATVFDGGAVPSDPSLDGAIFAAGTRENLPTWYCLNYPNVYCAGAYWFHLFGSGGWDTRTVPNGRYRLCVDAYDAVLNHARSCVSVTVAN